MAEDFDLGGFDEAYDISDFGQPEMDFASAIGAQTGGFGDDNTSQTIANFTAQPQVGLNRSNIIGSANFSPTFAAALDISQGIDPTLNLGGTGGLTVPSYLRPQIPGEFMDSDLGEADMVRPMFFSQGEKFLQQTLPEIVRSGPISRLARGIGSVLQGGASKAVNTTKEALDGGIGYMKNALGGLSFEDITNSVNEAVSNLFPARDTSMNVGTEADLMLGDTFPEVYRGGKGTASIPDALYPGQNTFGSSGPLPMNTGIAGLSYVNPQQTFDSRVSVLPIDQLMFDRMGMKPRYDFDIKELDAKDFQPGGEYSAIGKNRSGNFRVVQRPDGGLNFVDVGI